MISLSIAYCRSVGDEAKMGAMKAELLRIKAQIDRVIEIENKQNQPCGHPPGGKESRNSGDEEEDWDQAPVVVAPERTPKSTGESTSTRKRKWEASEEQEPQDSEDWPESDSSYGAGDDTSTTSSDTSSVEEYDDESRAMTE